MKDKSPSPKKPINLKAFLHRFFHIAKFPLLVAIVFLACQFLISLLAVRIFGEKITAPIPNTILSIIIYAVAFLSIIYLSIKLFHQSRPTRTELGLNSTPTWTDILLAPIGFIANLLLAAILIFLFQFLPFFDATQPQELSISTLISGFDRLLVFFLFAVVAPIAEELIFRGWLYQKLRTHIKKHSILLSTLITSVLFGALHGQLNVGVNVFVMSVIACLLRELTGTIYSGILLHILKNAVAFYLVFVLHFGF